MIIPSFKNEIFKNATNGKYFTDLSQVAYGYGDNKTIIDTVSVKSALESGGIPSDAIDIILYCMHHGDGATHNAIELKK